MNKGLKHPDRMRAEVDKSSAGSLMNKGLKPALRAAKKAKSVQPAP